MRTLWGLFAICLLSACAHAPASIPIGTRGTLLLAEGPFGEGPLRMRHLRLRNGLQVVLLRDPALGVVAHETCLPMGYGDDPPQRHGLAHLVEHLVYEQDHSQILETLARDRAGYANAGTWHEFTCFDAVVPPDAVPLLLRHDAWRLGALRADGGTLERERANVIQQEEEFHGSVGRQITRRLDDLVFGGDPDGYRSATWRAEISRITMADAQGFFQRHYRASAAALVLVGAFDEQEVLELLEQNHGALPADPAPAVRHRPPAPLEQERRMTFRSGEFDAEQLILAYPAPPLGHRDAGALDVLAEAVRLRLDERLVHGPGPVTGVSARFSIERAERRLQIEVEVVEGRDPAEALPLVEAELARLREELLGEEELLGAARGAELAMWSDMETAHERAQALARHHMVGGGVGAIGARAAAMRRVRARDLRRVAGRYLDPVRRVVVFAEWPASAAEEAEEPAGAGAEAAR